MDSAETLWKDNLRRLGEYIRAQRQYHQLSQRDLARLSDLSDTYMSQLERGLHEPSIRVLAGPGREPRPPPRPAHHVGRRAPARRRREPSTEEAIRRDPRFTEAQRRALLSVVRSYLEVQRSLNRPAKELRASTSPPPARPGEPRRGRVRRVPCGGPVPRVPPRRRRPPRARAPRLHGLRPLDAAAAGRPGSSRLPGPRLEPGAERRPAPLHRAGPAAAPGVPAPAAPGQGQHHRLEPRWHLRP